MPWPDRVVGIVLGVALGIGIVALFVFVFSERTVDAPSISGNVGGVGRGGPSVAPLRTVRIAGGAPPVSGPVDLHYRKDEHARIRVVSDAAVGVELLGYGIQRTVEAGKPALISFKATKPGDFPLIVTASRIDVARITVGPPTAP
jgi:hypothetical protein